MPAKRMKNMLDKEAQKEIMEHYSHPYYWAGFVVTGKSDKIIYPSATKKLIFIILFLLIVSSIISLMISKKFFKSSPTSS